MRRRTGLNYLPEFIASLGGPWLPAPERVQVMERLNPLRDRFREPRRPANGLVASVPPCTLTWQGKTRVFS